MFHLADLAKLRAMCRQLDIDIRTLWNIMHELLDLGLPPSPEEASAFRSWLIDLAPTLKDLAEMTDIALDDAAVTFLAQVLESDDNWKLFYGLFMVVWSRMSPSEKVAASDEEIRAAQRLSDGVAVSIDWSVIMDLIQAIIDILEMFKDRRR